MKVVRLLRVASFVTKQNQRVTVDAESNDQYLYVGCTELAEKKELAVVQLVGKVDEVTTLFVKTKE